MLKYKYLKCPDLEYYHFHCTDLHPWELYVVKDEPREPMEGEPHVWIDAEEVMHGPRHVDTEGDGLAQRLQEACREGHHVEAQPQPPTTYQYVDTYRGKDSENGN